MSNPGARNHPAVLALVIFMMLTSACAQKPSPNNSEATPVLSGPPNTMYPMPPLNATESAAGMTWLLSDGQRVKVSDFRGKVLVLDFYATWCAPCRESVPHLVQLQTRSGAQGLQVVGLNVGGDDDRLSVAAFAREFNIQYPLGIPDKPLTDFFLSDNDTIPQTFVFNRSGELVKRFIGYDMDVRSQLEQVIDTALKSSSD
jgi:thiol-disulfide isomerase/thioredoxin